MAKSPDAFRTISEVADWLGIQAHVLRFWESKFAPVKPVKRAGGRRYYRPADMLLLGGIKKLLHDDGLTIKGVQKILREQGVNHVCDLSQSIDDHATSIEVEAEEISATVLQFQHTPLPDPDDEGDDTDDFEDDVEPDLFSGDDPALKADSEAEETKPDAEPEDVAEAESAARETPQTQDAPAALPAFLNRSARNEDTAASTKAAPPAPQPQIARPAIVTAHDPGPDASQPYTPGALGQLAGLDYLTSAQAAEIEPLAQELRDWLSRATA